MSRAAVPPLQRDRLKQMPFLIQRRVGFTACRSVSNVPESAFRTLPDNAERRKLPIHFKHPASTVWMLLLMLGPLDVGRRRGMAGQLNGPDPDPVSTVPLRPV
jgi:hypothetical protein